MDIFKIRNELRTKSIFDIKLRVTFYARVSSEKDEQLNSLDNQIDYYKNFIKNNPTWTYVEGYIDEGISGISTEKRESFQQMLEDANEDMFDLIITKEISRFARNTLDSIQYTRELLSKGICVFFQNDNINTIDEDSELRLTIMSSIAQDELRKLSSRIKFGHHQAIKNGVVMGNSRIFGYKKSDKKLVIDEKEAPMIKLVFDLYSTDEYSMKQIENILYEKGYRNHNGNKISHTTLANMISNPKYKGYYVGNKVVITDLFTKKQKFLPEEDWVMYKDETGEIVPAIVDEYVWDKANEVLKRRSLDVKARRNSHNHQNLFTKKLYCTCCNTPYYMKAKAGVGRYKHTTWICSNRSKNGRGSCKSFAIHEDDLQKIIFNAMKTCIPNINDLKKDYIEKANLLFNDNSLEDKINKLKNQLDSEHKKQSKLLELVTMSAISNDDFKRMNEEITKKISELNENLDTLKDKFSLNLDAKSYINNMIDYIKDIPDFIDEKKINRTFMNRYINRINVTPVDETTMNIDIILFTGQTFNSDYDKKPKGIRENNVGSTGQIFLVMCPVQHTQMERNKISVIGGKILLDYYVSVSVII